MKKSASLVDEDLIVSCPDCGVLRHLAISLNCRCCRAFYAGDKPKKKCKAKKRLLEEKDALDLDNE